MSISRGIGIAAALRDRLLVQIQRGRRHRAELQTGRGDAAEHDGRAAGLAHAERQARARTWRSRPSASGRASRSLRVSNALIDSGTFCRFSARRVAVTMIVSSPPEVWADAVPATPSVAEIAAASAGEPRPGVSRLVSDMRLSPRCSSDTNRRSPHGQSTVRRVNHARRPGDPRCGGHVSRMMATYHCRKRRVKSSIGESGPGT